MPVAPALPHLAVVVLGQAPGVHEASVLVLPALPRPGEPQQHLDGVQALLAAVAAPDRPQVRVDGGALVAARLPVVPLALDGRAAGEPGREGDDVVPHRPTVPFGKYVARMWRQPHPRRAHATEPMAGSLFPVRPAPHRPREPEDHCGFLRAPFGRTSSAPNTSATARLMRLWGRTAR